MNDNRSTAMNASNIISSIYQKESNPEKRDALNVLHWGKLMDQLLGLPIRVL